ncbi:biotin/lipoyl-binding protein, partial [Escherichia coli]|nr:biotin/lipoyl-binding protein [Escherichia coli]
FCSFTQRIDVNGEVITLPHSVNVYAPQQGFIVSQYVKVGDLVKKGQPLYEIDISRDTTTGNVSSVQIEVNKEKIANAEEIINKLSQNKQETLSSIEKQLKANKESLKEINRLLANALAGLKKMHDNLSSYD